MARCSPLGLRRCLCAEPAAPTLCLPISFPTRALGPTQRRPGLSRGALPTGSLFPDLPQRGSGPSIPEPQL